jgi:hypothetical protein
LNDVSLIYVLREKTESDIPVNFQDKSIVEEFIPKARARSEAEDLEKWEDVPNPPDGRSRTYGSMEIVEDWFTKSGSM